MNTTQYYKHENFLVVQNGNWNDTFCLDRLALNGEFRFLVEYLNHFDYSEHSLQRVSNLLYHYCKGNIELFKEWYGFAECIIPNPKVRIEFNHDCTKDLQGRFAFYLNNRFVIAAYSEDYAFLFNTEGDLLKAKYLKRIFEADKENRTKLNQIIHSLNILSNYDAN